MVPTEWIMPQRHNGSQATCGHDRQAKNLETIVKIADGLAAHPGHPTPTSDPQRYTRPTAVHAEAMHALYPEVQRRCLTMDPDAPLPVLGTLSAIAPDGNTLHAFFHPDQNGQLVMRWIVELTAMEAAA